MCKRSSFNLAVLETQMYGRLGDGKEDLEFITELNTYTKNENFDLDTLYQFKSFWIIKSSISATT